MLQKIKEFTLITVGTIVMAFGISVFLVPNNVITGGVSGVATILHFSTRFPVGTYVLLINIPIFIVGWWKLGKRIGLRTLYAVVIMSVVMNLFEKIPFVTQDLFIAAIFGGFLTGLGMGIVFSGYGTTGGTDILAKLFQMAFKSFPIGKVIIILDLMIIAVSMIVFKDMHVGLYSVIALTISGFTIDMYLEGLDFAKMVYIISESHEAIASELGKQLSRGSTGFYAKGMYSNDDKIVLLCTLRRNELPRLRTIVKEIDRDAFVVLSDAREVLGKGFKMD